MRGHEEYGTKLERRRAGGHERRVEAISPGLSLEPKIKGFVEVEANHQVVSAQEPSLTATTARGRRKAGRPIEYKSALQKY